MYRRNFIRKALAGMAGGADFAVTVRNGFAAVLENVTGAARSPGKAPANARDGKFFPTDLPEREWSEFPASGFAHSVCGAIFRSGKPPCCGVPLGGVSTGCLDIEATGVIGFNCLFDAFPRKPQLLEPFLGLAVGDRAWVLTTELIRAGGVFETCHEPRRNANDWVITRPFLKGVSAAKEIYYWGHFPVADLEYATDAPVEVGVRAWAPFLPGDTATSNTPGAVFEVRLRNKTASPQKGTLAFSFPGPTQQEAQVPAMVQSLGIQIGGMSASRPQVPGGVQGRHDRIRTPVNGISVVVETGVGYVLGVIGDEQVRTGGGLGGRLFEDRPQGFFPAKERRQIETWAKIRTLLPEAQPRNFSGTVAVDFSLEPGEMKTLRFVLAWYAPQWHGEGENRYTQMYSMRFKNAVEVAQFLARDHSSLLKRVLAWQEAIYTDQELPVWLRDCLINILATIPEDSYWAVPRYPVDWAPADGIYGMNECPRGSPQIECIPCSWYGNIPIVYFYPELALSTLRGHAHYMREDGAAPFRWGPGADFANLMWEWQKSLNGVCFVDMVGRLWLRTGDDAILKEFYPAVKKSTICTMTLRAGADGVVSMPEGNVGREWWESEDWYGIVPHIGGMHLSNLKIAERMAEATGDTAFVQQCRNWYREGSASLEEKAWAGEYYLHYYEPKTGQKSDVIMANQTDGDWANAFHGLPNIFRADRLPKVLATVKRTCLNETCGAISFAYSDGTPQIRSYGIFVPENMILGMSYLYAGDRETGLEIVRRLMYDLVCRHGHAFDLPNMVFCDTGERWFGTDYYQNMMLWAVPAAISQKDLRGPCAPGGLVDRVLKAAKKI